MEDGVDAEGMLYERAREELAAARGRRLRFKPFRVSYRPFAGLRSVVYDRGDHFDVRLADLIRDAPEDARSSLARILIGNIDPRLRATPDERAAFRTWSRSDAVAQADERLRGQRGRKRMLPPRGQAHDLDALFDRVNAESFQGLLPRPRLGWTLRAGRSLYGHQDPAHNAIVISRRLDHARVPEAVVVDILHHEMLHIKHGVRRGPGGRRIVHSRAFRLDERSHPGHEEARRWLRGLETGRVRLRQARPQPQRSLLDFARSLFASG